MLQRHVGLLVLITLFFCFLTTSCGVSPRKYKPSNKAPEESDMMPMPRADPAYLQYLERQSMLSVSREMAEVVSGSELAWRGSVGSPQAMLNYADTWVAVHPMTLLTSSRSSAFGLLSDTSTWPILREVSAKGLYVAPVQSNGAMWVKDSPTVNTGDDAVLYSFSPAAGKDDQYRRLMSRVIDQNALLGSDLIPAATGLGPDFFLAARGVREYPGIYCMMEIPENLQHHLPDVTTEWGGAALGQSQVEALSAKGLLPKAMRGELSPFGHSGGWAATGQVRGVDGNNHRWVYRYHKSPEYAVLNWEDPSKTAHRILSGSAVRQVGLQGQALIGLRFEAFQGLDAVTDGSTSSGAFSIEPARTAAQAMSREIRRFGAWSWLRDDALPLHSLQDFLYAGADFAFDSAFSPASEHALLTGDASLLRYMADEVLRLGVDTRRLVHTMPTQDGINYALPHLQYLAARGSGDKAASFRRSIQGAMASAASRVSPPIVQNNHLYSTGAGLAALALDASTAQAAQAKADEIAKGHSLLIFFKAMQPGVLMLAGQDLSGVLPLSWSGIGATTPANAARGSYSLTGSGGAVSGLGMPRAPYIYPAADTQVHNKRSFLSRVGSFLRPRTELGIAKGTLIKRPETKGKGSIALLSRMPDGKSYLLSVCNFSRQAVTETIRLSGTPGIASAMSRVTPIATGGSHSVSGQTVTVTLGPWQGRALLLGNTSAVAVDVQDDLPAEDATPIPSAE